MSETAVPKEGHCGIAQPWKEETSYPENNNTVAEHRLRFLKKRILLNPDLLVKYKECIEDLLEKGYTTSVPATSTSGKTCYLSNVPRVSHFPPPGANDGAGNERPWERGWYLPHHGVVHPSKPGKDPVVFDCSAKYWGQSLYDQLLQGPDLTNSSPSRTHYIAFMSNIEAMFHQVRVLPDDSDALRFQSGDRTGILRYSLKNIYSSFRAD